MKSSCILRVNHIPLNVLNYILIEIQINYILNYLDSKWLESES